MGRGDRNEHATGSFSPLYGRHPVRRSARKELIERIGVRGFQLIMALQRARRPDGTPPAALDIRLELDPELARSITSSDVAQGMRRLERSGMVFRTRYFGSPLRYQVSECGRITLDQAGELIDNRRTGV